MHLSVLAEFPSRLCQRADSAFVKDHLRQIVLHDGLRCTFLNAAEHENRRGDARVPQLDTLFRNGDGQHVRARFQRRFCDGHRSVAVCVRLEMCIRDRSS